MVSTKPHCGNIRGGASGNTMWTTSAMPVSAMTRLRAQTYCARGRNR